MKTIKLPATINELSTINEIVDQFIVDNDELKFKVQLIVEELLTNIEKYAYEGVNDEDKYLNFVAGYVYFDGQQSVFLQLVYGGSSFDPFVDAAMPDVNQDITERNAGGLGLFLIKQVATHYTYARIDDYNQVQIYLDVSNNQAD